ncbi:MAG: peroxidase family protein [Hyphomicrobiaceae bacterium]
MRTQTLLRVLASFFLLPGVLDSTALAQDRLTEAGNSHGLSYKLAAVGQGVPPRLEHKRDRRKRPQSPRVVLRDAVSAYLLDRNGRKCMGFGRLFPLQSSAAGEGPALRSLEVGDRVLQRLGKAMVERQTGQRAGDSEMPAGYTFLAQFIDHDITLDTTSMLGRPLRDEEFSNARTVALDLDSVYGRGPEQDPYLYRLPYLRVGKQVAGCGPNSRFDLLRVGKSDAPGPRGGAARALIGDPRNDENFVLAQLHSTFIAFHNRLVDLLIERRFARQFKAHCRGNTGCDHGRIALALPGREKKKIYEEARDHVIHYYHRIIAEDFLPRLIGEVRLHDILNNGRDFYFPNGFDRNPGHVFIPVEFAVAAFRYGHSQVRERYQLRRGVRTKLLDAARSTGGGSPAFQPIRRDLLVDWHYFFPIRRTSPAGFNFARRIDPAIAPFLHQLGRSQVVSRDELVSLPARNLSRGRTFRLPPGQAVATRILPALHARGLLPNDWIGTSRTKHGRKPDWTHYVLEADQRTRRLTGQSATPLWYYLLQEAEQFGGPSWFGLGPEAVAGTLQRGRLRLTSLSRDTSYSPSRPRPYRVRNTRTRSRDRHGGHTLGPVGGTLVGEVLTGLLEYYRVKTGEGLSYRPVIRASRQRNPQAGLSLTAVPHLNRGHTGRYLMANLIVDAGHASPLTPEAHDGDRCAPPAAAYDGLAKDYSGLPTPQTRTATRAKTRKYRSRRRADKNWADRVWRNN